MTMDIDTSGSELLPENWSKRRERKSGKMGHLKGELSDEKNAMQKSRPRAPCSRRRRARRTSWIAWIYWRAFYGVMPL
jgi:hypothetical protein